MKAALARTVPAGTSETADEGKYRSWHALAPELVLERVGATEEGLTSGEAEQRRLRFGQNEIREAKAVRPIVILGRQFQSLVIWILIFASLISGVLGEWIDCIAVLTIVLLNAFIGFYQEVSAEKAIAALKKMTSPRAKVWRDGNIVVIDTVNVVPGDIVELEAGDIIPADARLLRTKFLRCLEAPLTGESSPVDKEPGTLEAKGVALGDRFNMVFMGTSVATGEGRAVVVGTGMGTEIGTIANLIEGAAGEERTPLQKKIDGLGRVLAWASLGLIGLVFALGLLRGMQPLELFMTAVSLAVAAVPEGLPAVVTIALALGVKRMAERRALIRRLPSIETLGCTTVICSDKTGTLTVGEMTARELFVSGKSYSVTGEGYAPVGAILFNGKPPEAADKAILKEVGGILVGCNNAHLTELGGQWTVAGDPTEGAMLAVGLKLGVNPDDLNRRSPRLHEIPFDSDRKRRTVVRSLPEGKARILVNGAPDVLLRHCNRLLTVDGVRSLTEEERRRLAEKNSEMAHRALRVLGAAYRDENNPSQSETELERNLIFAGLVGMYDPPRAEAKAAVARCVEAGIRVVMITGDHPQTAVAVGRELGIAENEKCVLSGVELDQISDHELQQRVAKVAIYARVTAEHKLRIVRAWKANKAIVAMTGDGVNDAPAIKGADIGIAMGKTGTEVTKQASDMIVTDDNFASIVAAVEEGRGIYDNIRRSLQFLLASNLGELILIMGTIIAGWPMALLPIHLLWINLVTDGPPALCLAAEPVHPHVMRRRPRENQSSIMDADFLKRMLAMGALVALLGFAVFGYSLRNETLEVAQTRAFGVLVMAQLFASLAFRSGTHPFWKSGLPSNWKLIGALIILAALQMAIHQSDLLSGFLKLTPLPWMDWLGLVLLAAIPTFLLEATKLGRASTGNKENLPQM